MVMRRMPPASLLNPSLKLWKEQAARTRKDQEGLLVLFFYFPLIFFFFYFCCEANQARARPRSPHRPAGRALCGGGGGHGGARGPATGRRGSRARYAAATARTGWSCVAGFDRPIRPCAIVVPRGVMAGGVPASGSCAMAGSMGGTGGGTGRRAARPKPLHFNIILQRERTRVCSFSFSLPLSLPSL